MGKYEPLGHYLFQIGEDQKSLRFVEIEAILGFALPNSARKHRAWWGNDATGNHTNATDGWLAAKWKVEKVDMKNETVLFTRIAEGLESKPEIQPREKELALDDKSKISVYEEIEKLHDEFKEQKTELSVIRNNINQLDGKINAILSWSTNVKADIADIKQDQSRFDENINKEITKLEHQSNHALEEITGIGILVIVIGFFIIWFGIVSLNIQTITPIYSGIFWVLCIIYIFVVILFIWMHMKKWAK